MDFISPCIVYYVLELVGSIVELHQFEYHKYSVVTQILVEACWFNG